MSALARNIVSPSQEASKPVRRPRFSWKKVAKNVKVCQHCEIYQSREQPRPPCHGPIVGSVQQKFPLARAPGQKLQKVPSPFSQHGKNKTNLSRNTKKVPRLPRNTKKTTFLETRKKGTLAFLATRKKGTLAFLATRKKQNQSRMNRCEGRAQAALHGHTTVLSHPEP